MSLVFDPTPLADALETDPATAAPARAAAVDPSLRPAFQARDAATDHLERLFDEGALCVTTGQQPGLLTGPLFTIHKALSTVALARELAARLDRPVVPVFWTAGDDHDFAEANHIHLVNLENAVERVSLRERDPAAPLVPLYREPLGPEIAGVLDAVRRTTPDTEFKDEILAWIERHYTPEHDLAGAFAGALAELFGPAGLVVFRPTHPAAKARMAPYLLEALRQAASLDEALGQRARELAARGAPVPVGVGEGATNVMIECQLGRDRLMIGDGGFTARRSGERWTLAELEGVARNAPVRLSPNVLLRPVIEAALLPTLAYVAGPGELAYLPQCAPLYRALDVAPQAPVPRWSGRVIEARVAKVLEKFALTPDDLAGPEGQLETRLVQDEMPDDATAALAALRKAVGTEYARLERAAAVVDPTLKKPVQSARNAALAGVQDLEKRILAHLKKQNEILQQQLAKARHHLYPLGRPQERVFNVVPYLIRYGHAFVDQAADASAAWMASLTAPRS